MATKKEITNFATSQDLKAAMLTKGLDVSPNAVAKAFIKVLEL